VSITLDELRRFAVARSLFPPTTLKRALHRFGFVQADPIRAPARAQDLTLRHRVRNYRAGDLERRFATLGVEEDFFVNYGFVTRSLQALMHPRSETGVPADAPRKWPAARRKKAALLLEFVRERGAVHPREVDDHFSHGSVRNYWGGSSSATTHLLDAMHYRGLLRVARRTGGVRIYAAHEHRSGPIDAAERRARLDALVDTAVGIYAPLPGRSLSSLVRRLRFAAPQWSRELTSALQRATERLASASRRHRLVLAGGGEPGGLHGAGFRSPADALRPRRARPGPLRAAVGLGLPLRGVHAGVQTAARLLRASAPVARPCDRLGQSLRTQRRAPKRRRVRRVAASRPLLPPRARGRARSDAGFSRAP
jgi:uncharacterized protein YcaQ